MSWIDWLKKPRRVDMYKKLLGVNSSPKKGDQPSQEKTLPKDTPLAEFESESGETSSKNNEPAGKTSIPDDGGLKASSEGGGKTPEPPKTGNGGNGDGDSEPPRQRGAAALRKLEKCTRFWPVATIGIGAILALIPTAILFFLFSGFADNLWGGSLSVFLVSYLISVAILFKDGLEEIEVGWVGVMTFFGKRIHKPVLDEGYPWIFPPPLMSIRHVDMRERTLPIKDAEVRAGGAGKFLNEDGTLNLEKLDLVGITLDSTLQYRVMDPVEFLSVDLGEMETGLHDLVQSSARRNAPGRNPIELLIDTGGFSESISDELEGRGSRSAEATIDRWGILVVKLNVKKIKTTDDEVNKALESIQKERLQAMAETIEAQNLIDNSAIVATGLSADGETVTRKEAAVLFQRERGKGQHIVTAGEGGGRQPDIADKILAGLQGRKE
jgi:regulator of protease activity HflC (stomatin/prohibitin superfamily)